MLINIKNALRLRCLHQYQLARRSGVSEAFISLVISGRRTATPDLRQKIASVLSCDEDWLFRQIELPSFEREVVLAAQTVAAAR